MSESRVAIRNVALALSIACIILASGLIVVFVHYEGTISNKDSQIKMLTDQMARLTGWLEGNKSALDALSNVTNSINTTGWPARQPEPSWKIDFYKGFTMSWPQLYWSVKTPEWKLYCGGYSKAIIYMRMTNISSSLQGSRTTIFLNYLMWYGSTEGGNDFLGMTTLSENDLNVTVPGPFDPQAGPIEVETKGPYLMFIFAVDSTYNVSASAAFDLSVYFRN
jgi:hypothetical protein